MSVREFCLVKSFFGALLSPWVACALELVVVEVMLVVEVVREEEVSKLPGEVRMEPCLLAWDRIDSEGSASEGQKFS